jgi:4-hydroxythreonine-4-phosphate dehydrogenase
VVLGSRALLTERALMLGTDIELDAYLPGAPPRGPQTGRLQVLDIPLATACVAGRLDTANARHVLALLDRATDGCVSGEFAAMVTAPVQKSVINDAGIPFTGHTEYLAARTGAAQPVMLLAADTLRVALATTHLPLRAVSDAITATLPDSRLPSSRPPPSPSCR